MKKSILWLVVAGAMLALPALAQTTTTKRKTTTRTKPKPSVTRTTPSRPGQPSTMAAPTHKPKRQMARRHVVRRHRVARVPMKRHVVRRHVTRRHRAAYVPAHRRRAATGAAYGAGPSRTRRYYRRYGATYRPGYGRARTPYGAGPSYAKRPKAKRPVYRRHAYRYPTTRVPVRRHVRVRRHRTTPTTGAARTRTY